VGSIIVSGAMRAGGPTCRLASRLTLTFHALPGINPIDMVRLWMLGWLICAWV
jgi:hypothetical protein